MAASPTLASSRCVGPYQVLAPLGRARADSIYHARDTRADRTVLVKVIAADSERREALIRNVAAAAFFSHPDFVRILEIGVDDQEHVYLVSESIPGYSLHSLLAGRRYSPRRSIALTMQLAAAVADAHEAALLHGDLKPDEIIITPKGDGKILHIGVATGRASDCARQRDRYMSPERMLGDEVDFRSDVFSLGAILVEMLTHHPDGSEPAVAALAKRHRMDLQLPANFSRRAAADLRAILARALAENVDDRCGSAAAFAAELGAVAAILDLHSGVV